MMTSVVPRQLVSREMVPIVVPLLMLATLSITVARLSVSREMVPILVPLSVLAHLIPTYLAAVVALAAA